MSGPEHALTPEEEAALAEMEAEVARVRAAIVAGEIVPVAPTNPRLEGPLFEEGEEESSSRPS